MYSPSRDQARRFLFDTWRKFKMGEALSQLESLAAEILVQHPEYHALLDQPKNYLEQEYFPEGGATNPFLHLSLHLAIAEQIAIDQPPGIRTAFERLCGKLGNEHDARHAVMECLGETIWQAQRNGTAPDQQLYLDCLMRK